MRLLNKLYVYLGRSNYSTDPALSNFDVFILLMGKGICLLRGFLLMLFVKKSSGFVFIGRRCKFVFRRKISFGRTVVIGDNVEINALSKFGVSIGNNVTILKGTIIECTGVLRELGEGLIIGNNVGIAQNCFIQVRGKVIIGNDVIFGPNVSIFSENHMLDDPDIPVSTQGVTRIGVTIENGVWIGTRSVILDGVTVGQNSVVAAGSIVNKNVPPFTIVGGVPARILKTRKSTF